MEAGMRDDLHWLIKLPSVQFEQIRDLQARNGFLGRVELIRTVPEGPWDLSAIIGCEFEADFVAIGAMRDRAIQPNSPREASMQIDHPKQAGPKN